jgi:hypothetical protein
VLEAAGGDSVGCEASDSQERYTVEVDIDEVGEV